MDDRSVFRVMRLLVFSLWLGSLLCSYEVQCQFQQPYPQPYPQPQPIPQNFPFPAPQNPVYNPFNQPFGAGQVNYYGGKCILLRDPNANHEANPVSEKRTHLRD